MTLATKPNENSLKRWFPAAILIVATLFSPGCKNFPYKIDPSGDRLITKNDPAESPANKSPFVGSPQSSATSSTTSANGQTVSQTTIPAAGMTTSPGFNVLQGTADPNAPIFLGQQPNVQPLDRRALVIPGNGSILLVSPQEQVALVGSELMIFASYLGKDQHLRTGEKMEWSLDGCGHIMTTNKIECGSWMIGNFSKEKKVSDRYAVTTTTLFEGNVDRGSVGQVPVLAGQSWATIQSAVEGTTTITALAPSIDDWQRRSDRAVIHWIDAEWIFPSPDFARFGETKSLTTTIKKRSSSSPSPGWQVRYEITGGPDAVFESTKSKTADVVTDENGKATVNIQQLSQAAGTNTISVKIVKPAGISGEKKLELGTGTVSLTWSKEELLKASLNLPQPGIVAGQPATGQIVISNYSNTSRSCTVELPLPDWVKHLSSTPPATQTKDYYGTGTKLIWTGIEISAQSKVNIDFVIQPDSETSQPLNLKVDLTQISGNGETWTSATESPLTSNSAGNTPSPPPAYPSYEFDQGYNAGSDNNGTSGNIAINPAPGVSTGGITTQPPANGLQGNDVKLTVTPPQTMRVGTPAQFLLTIENNANRDLADVSLIFLFSSKDMVYYEPSKMKDYNGPVLIPLVSAIRSFGQQACDPQIKAYTAGKYEVTVKVVVPDPKNSGKTIDIATQSFTVNVNSY